MYCPKCGKQAGDSLAYCPECAASLALPGQVPAGAGGQVVQEPVDLSRNTAARAGLIVGAVLSVLFSFLVVSGFAEEPIRDSETAIGLGVLTVFFLLLVWCAGYLSRSAGAGYAFGVGFCCIEALGSLAGVAVAGVQDNRVGVVMWVAEFALFAAAAFAFRGLLVRGGRERVSHGRALSRGPNKCPRCGHALEPAWTTCRGCALPLTVPGLASLSPGSAPGGAAPGEGFGKAVVRGVTKTIVWLTAGR